MFTQYARGMVYWCDIPKYDERSTVQAGRRPVIIVSNNVGNVYSGNVTVVPLTTNTDKNPEQPTHYRLNLNKNEDSMVLAEMIITVSKTLLCGFMGMLDEITMREVDKAIMVALGLVNVPEPKVKEKTNDEVLEEKQTSNRGRRVSGPIEMRAFLNYYEHHTVEETMAEYGVPNRASVLQRVQWYKKKLDM